MLCEVLGDIARVWQNARWETEEGERMQPEEVATRLALGIQQFNDTLEEKDRERFFKTMREIRSIQNKEAGIPEKEWEKGELEKYIREIEE